MKSAIHAGLVVLALGSWQASSQEASSGLDLRGTLTAQLIGSNAPTESPRSGSPLVAGSRGVVYPTVKFNEHWFLSGALQLVTRPYYYSDLSTAGFGAKVNILTGTLNYTRVSNRGSLLLRGGEMSSAFGSFLLRYDDQENALIDLPPQYGYYYAPVSFLPVAGAELDASAGKWDARLQFANSSPANPRSIFARDQYGNWSAGAGYTIRQGFRLGVSGYRGPYLDRKYAYFFPGEANPSTLPAHAIGVDGNWAHGHSSACFEVQRFVMPYTLFPDFRETAGYIEVRQVLSPRWFVAGRYALTSTNVAGRTNVFETAAGFRPDRFQLLKFGYQEKRAGSGAEPDNHTAGIELITTFHRSMSR